MAHIDLKLLESHTIPDLEKTVRLSDLPMDVFHFVNSRKGWKKMIKKGLVYVEGKSGFTADYIYGGELIEIFQSSNLKQRPFINLNLTVLFEDEHLAVVNKPAGIEVSGNKKWTLENALLSNLITSNQIDALPFPEAIHRLDYPTTGVLLIGKTASSTVALNKEFAERAVQKTYYAIAIGLMEKWGEINSEVDSKPSLSEFEVVETVISERFAFLNLVKLTPHTGRKHQLRKHLAGMGHPILGDQHYGSEGLILKGKGLYLHALSLEFNHPATGLRTFVESPLPNKFLKIFPKN